MADDLDLAVLEAEGRGRRSLESEPRALSARYDAASGRVLVELRNGCAFAFPARLCEELADADSGDLAKIEILGAGYGLHWETLDVDLSVPGLLAGLFGPDEKRNVKTATSKRPNKVAAAGHNSSRAKRPPKGTV